MATSLNEGTPQWYVIHTYSGYENAVKTAIEQAAENRGMQDKIFELRVPTEEVTESKDGKEKTTERKIYPGYVIVNMIIDDESWHLVRNVRGVTGFIGTQTTAVPLTPAEIEKMGLNSETPSKVDAKADFAVDEAVVVLDGPLSGQFGTIVQVDAARQSAIVIVSMFGRETPVELSFSQIKREA